jgi:hypothetical protein
MPTPPPPPTSILAKIPNEIRLKERLRRQWQAMRDPALRAQINHLPRSVTYSQNEWRNDQWRDTLKSLDSDDHWLWTMTKRALRDPTPSTPLQVPGGLALSEPEKAETMTPSFEAQFQPVDHPSDPDVLSWHAYKYAPASEPKLSVPRGP